MRPLRNRRKNDSAVKLGTYLESILSGYGLGHNLAGWKIVINWAKIVGGKNAEHSRAIKFSDETILVKVPDAGWRQELSLEADKILGEIHKFPGGEVVKKIHFVS